ncbi:MAG: signal recognition particle-docking protein FtsY [Candidatus Lokiarchaeota archaeon]
MLDKLKNAFSSFVKKSLTEDKLEDSIEDLKILLIKNDVAMETADVICKRIIDNFKGKEIGLLSSTQKFLYEILENVISEILTPKEEIDLLDEIEEKNSHNLPYIMLFLGVNGTGKTKSVVAAASDTFRAGAIEQLSYHMNKVGVKVIKHKYQADPASVAYDTIEHAKAKNLDVVLIDTAGRQVTDNNLMAEIQKICRVAQPNLKLFIGDSLAGNDALFQAKEFNKSVGIDVSILTKLDADAQGGAALSVAFETQKPIIFVGIGQGYDDLKPFDPTFFIANILERD